MNAPGHPSIWIPVIVLITIVIVACLIDVVRRSHVKHLPKAAWALIVVLVVPSERSPTWPWDGAREQR